MFLGILQNSQENTCARLFFLIKLQASVEAINVQREIARVGYNLTRLRPATLLKKRLWHRCFPVNFAKFLGTLFVTEHLRARCLDNIQIDITLYHDIQRFIISEAVTGGILWKTKFPKILWNCRENTYV